MSCKIDYALRLQDEDFEEQVDEAVKKTVKKSMKRPPVQEVIVLRLLFLIYQTYCRGS